MGVRLSFPNGTPEPEGRTNLTAGADTFVGRTAELDELRAVWRDPDRRWVTLVGPPGVGKTRLASHLGWTLVNTVAAVEAWFCGLTEAHSELEVLSLWLTQLDPAAPMRDDIEALWELLVAELAERHAVLLILDGVDALVDTLRPMVGRLLSRLPQVQVVVTSRQPLHGPDEQQMRLGPLPTTEAVALFKTRAQSYGVPPVKAEDEVLRELVERLDGFPLAIELAAARRTIMTPRQMLNRLERRFRLLDGSAPRRGKAALTLRQALDWSWDMLSPTEQSTLAQASVFRGGFTLELAEAIIALPPDEGQETPWVVDLLASLYDRSLLKTERDGATLRYALYASVHDYAADHLRSTTAIRDRHARTMLAWAQQRSAQLDTAHEAQALAQMARERSNLDAAFDHLLIHHPQDAAHLA
ncbi:MAG: AAA family ATPase, partial [Myxococcota bacterium]